MSVHIIEVQVLQPIKGGYRLKVSALDLGLYMNGWTMRPPNGDKDWWLQPPAQRLPNGKYMYPLEFNKSQTFWQEIYDECVRVVEQYGRDTAMPYISSDDEDFPERDNRELLDELDLPEFNN